ncbi:MAG: hypothetical protein FIA97_01515 [Methylococcaceae bacterium]|nr:hypothetical protein [Methylococcaceae bacterium]
MDTYPANVRTWCSAAGRPAPTATLLDSSTCHANKTPYQNLRSAPTNAGYLDYFCKGSPTPTPPPTPTNKAPVVKVKATANAVEGKLLSLTVTTSDPNGDPVTLAATNLPQGATFDPATGTFNWTPDAGTAASTPPVSVTFTATDTPSIGSPLTGNASVTIHVAASAGTSNNPPVIAAISDKNATVGKTLSFKVKASDKDGDAITLSAAGQPLTLGASFDAATGQFSWTPTADQVTTPSTPYTVTFTATDDATTPASVSEDVAIYVNAAGGGDATIKRVVIKKAQWRNGSSTLIVRGKVGRGKGKIADGLTVTVTDGNTGSTLGTATVNRKGGWSLNSSLDTAPCSVQAELNGLTASKSVARCGDTGGGGNGGDHDGDDHDGGKDDRDSDRNKHHDD